MSDKNKKNVKAHTLYNLVINMINDDCWPTTTTTTVLELGTQCKTNQGLLNMKNPPVSTSRLHWYNNHEPTKIRGRVYIIKKEKELMMKSPDKSCRRFKTLAFSCSRLAPFCRAKVSQDKIENRPTTLFPPLSLSTYPTSWKKKKTTAPLLPWTFSNYFFFI